MTLSTSGANVQARLALEHGKKMFLLHSLVTSQPRARNYIARRGAIEVADVDGVIKYLPPPERVRQATEQQQLTLALLTRNGVLGRACPRPRRSGPHCPKCPYVRVGPPGICVACAGQTIENISANACPVCCQMLAVRSTVRLSSLPGLGWGGCSAGMALGVIMAVATPAGSLARDHARLAIITDRPGHGAQRGIT